MSKKPPNSKRALLPRSVGYTKEFQKSWARYNRAGRRDMNLARKVMVLLFSGEKMPPEYLDHELEGAEWDGARELHIGGDFLLVYRLNEAKNLITFVELGTHSELFG